MACKRKGESRQSHASLKLLHIPFFLHFANEYVRFDSRAMSCHDVIALWASDKNHRRDIHHSRTNYNRLIGPYDSINVGDEVSIRSVKDDESYFSSL